MTLDDAKRHLRSQTPEGSLIALVQSEAIQVVLAALPYTAGNWDDNKMFVVHNTRMDRYLGRNDRRDRWVKNMNDAKFFFEGPSQFAVDELNSARHIAYDNDPGGYFEHNVLVEVTLTTKPVD